jgi:hypothetical protein
MRMRFAKASIVLVLGPVTGTAIGFIVAGLLLPPDPTGRGGPGDGFALFLGAGIGLLVSLVFSIVAAVHILRKPVQKLSG